MKKNVEKAYHKYRALMPDADFGQLEQAVRNDLWKKKKMMCASLFTLALLAHFLPGICTKVLPTLNSGVYELIEYVCKAVESVSIIAWAMTLAKWMHNPLTPQEAAELEERDHLEKTGKPLFQEDTEV